MTTYPTRAEWWREVTDQTEVIPKGCPMRREVGDIAREWIAEGNLGIGYLVSAHKSRFFIDSRWTPPRPAYKVGDVIEDCTPDNLPADGVAIVDAVGDVGQMDGKRLGWACGGGVTWGSPVVERCFPLTVIYVPKVGD